MVKNTEKNGQKCHFFDPFFAHFCVFKAREKSVILVKNRGPKMGSKKGQNNPKIGHFWTLFGTLF